MDGPRKPADGDDDEWRIGQYAVRERFVKGPLWVAHTAVRQGANGEERASIWMLSPTLELVRGRTNQLVKQLSGLSGHNRPGVVNVIAIGATQTGPYVITGDAEGETLEQRLRESSYPAAEVVRIVLSIAGVLGEAHTQSKAVHGALDASRILISERSPRIRLRELGWLEAVRVSGVVAPEAIVAAIPRGGAPELDGRSGAIGPATDQYALASIAFEILTGRKPAEDRAARSLPNERLTTHRQDLPSTIDMVLQSAWSADPSERYRSVLDFANAFRLAMLGGGVQEAASRASLWPRSASKSSPPAARMTNRPPPSRTPHPPAPERSSFDSRLDRDGDERITARPRVSYQPPAATDPREEEVEQPAPNATRSWRPAATSATAPASDRPTDSRPIVEDGLGSLMDAFEAAIPERDPLPSSRPSARPNADARPVSSPPVSESADLSESESLSAEVPTRANPSGAPVAAAEPVNRSEAPPPKEPGEARRPMYSLAPAAMVDAAIIGEAANRARPRVGLGAATAVVVSVAVAGYFMVTQLRTPPSPSRDPVVARSPASDPPVPPVPAIVAPTVAAVADAGSPAVAAAVRFPETDVLVAAVRDAGLRLWRPSPSERDEAEARMQAGLTVCTLQFGSYGRHARMDVTYEGSTGAPVIVQMHGPNYPRAPLRSCIENEVRAVRFAPFNQPRWITAYSLNVP